jgi:hypothetical protein
MNYSNFKSDYLETFQYFGRDTKRKQINTLNDDVNELEYRIENITTLLIGKDYAHFYGEIVTEKTLRELKRELTNTNILLTEIKNN